MWLRYGVDINNKLIEIGDVSSGRTNLRCPYCAGMLIAKKGKVKEQGILEGKHPEVVQWGGLETYLTRELPQVHTAQVVMAVQAIECWQLPTALQI